MKKPMDESYKIFINGQWVEGAEGKTFTTSTSATGEILSTCVDAGREDVDRAVNAAWKAFEQWKSVSPVERQQMLLKIADLIEANAEKLAMIETMDVGKPIRESRRDDVPAIIGEFRYFAGAIRADEGQATIINNNTMSLIIHEPIGVVGQIVPWNYPLVMTGCKIAPALAAGDCIVIKPSSLTPLSILELAKLINQVIPPGVVNVLTGFGSTTGKFMLEHPGFRKFAFTGSTEVGYKVARAAADHLIPATLELGGKSANIYFPDCPWEKAIEGLLIGILINQGQICSAGSRVFVHSDIYNKFVDEAIAAFEKIKVGIPWYDDTQMGALISESHTEKVLSYIDIGRKEGAVIATGGHRITENGLDKGCFVEPTILADVDNRMRVAQEEIFGPVVCIIKFNDEDEVIRMANDSEFGLCGAVWTKDVNRAIRVARGVETGRMWINAYNNSPVHAPFGGYKKSGIGRESHKMVLEHYTQKKNIIIDLSEKKVGIY